MELTTPTQKGKAAALQSSTNSSTDLGKLRGLQRIVSPEGHINACALDVLDYLVQLLDARGLPSSHRDIVALKRDLVTTLSPLASAVLLDAQYGLQSVASGALPGTTGLIVTIEDEDYATTSPADGRRTVFREGWTVHKIKMAGADVAKLLWFYRPDQNEATATHQREILKAVAEECSRESIALVVEPIWYPYPGEDSQDAEWQDRRVDGVVQSVFEAAALGADFVKAEFPGSLDTAASTKRATEACEQIGRDLKVPWITLSGGVPFERFKEQVGVSCRAGASGYLGGRAVWQETLDATNSYEHQKALERAAEKVMELNEITTADGRPFFPAIPADEVADVFPATWYLDWSN